MIFLGGLYGSKRNHNCLQVLTELITLISIYGRLFEVTMVRQPQPKKKPRARRLIHLFYPLTEGNTANNFISTVVSATCET
jgi:hypothetical protein